MVKVSVVIPAYNAMAFLEATVESVLHQTFTDFEVIIINDGSQDHIETWAKQIKDDRVKLISKENGGLSSARNAGISYSSGEYIAFLDADDLWLPTKLEKQVKYLDAYPEVGLVSTKVNIINDADQHVRSFPVPVKETISLPELLSYNYILCGSTPLVRRDCFATVGLFDSALSSAADWDMWIRIGLCYKLASVLDYLVCYRKHTSNMSGNVEKMALEIAKILEKSKTLLSKKNHEIINRRYAVCMLETAWAMGTTGKYRKAVKFSMRAFAATPEVAFSWSFAKLYLFIFTKKLVSQQQYSLLIQFHKLSKQLIMPKAK